MISTPPNLWSRISGLPDAMLIFFRNVIGLCLIRPGIPRTSHSRRLPVLAAAFFAGAAGLLLLNFGCAQSRPDTDQFFTASPVSRHELPSSSDAPARTSASVSRPQPRQQPCPQQRPQPRTVDSRPPHRPSDGSSVPSHHSLHQEPSVALVPWNHDGRGGVVSSHTVVRGETLAGIARRYYGDSSQWRVIYQANREIVGSPNNLPAGARLHIPRLPPAE